MSYELKADLSCQPVVDQKIIAKRLRKGTLATSHHEFNGGSWGFAAPDANVVSTVVDLVVDAATLIDVLMVMIVPSLAAYGLPYSRKVRKDLESDRATQFRDEAYILTSSVYEKFVEKHSASAGVMRLDAIKLIAAIDSAYLDLARADAFHEFEDGPSKERRAAAVCAWINRLHPIQFTGLIDSDFPIMANAIPFKCFGDK